MPAEVGLQIEDPGARERIAHSPTPTAGGLPCLRRGERASGRTGGTESPTAGGNPASPKRVAGARLLRVGQGTRIGGRVREEFKRLVT